jgi:hypothetical protein
MESDANASFRQSMEQRNSEVIWLSKRIGEPRTEYLLSKTVAEYDVIFEYELGLAKKEKEAYEKVKKK